MQNSKTNNNEMISKLVECINSVGKLMDDMCNCVYEGEGNRIFDNLNELINGLDFILSKTIYISNDIDANKIDEMLINLEKAISIKDYVLLTDVLIYELKPMFKIWSKLLETTLNND